MGWQKVQEVIVLGIDPGQTGGLAWLNEDGLIHAMPIPLRYPTKKATVDFDLCMENILCQNPRPAIAAIENVHAMPRQGVSSSFQFGRMFGGVEMVGQRCADRVVYVTPQKWKRHFGLSSDKGEAMAKATELYGDEYWPLKKHDGVAEAALIATWALATIGDTND